MKKTLILAPGLMCDTTVWHDQIAALSPHYDCQVPNYETEPSLPRMAQRLLAQAPRQFALAGHSMGGRVALEVMRQAPERVTHLALLDTGYLPLAAGEKGEREVSGRQELVALAQAEGTRAMGQRWVQGMVHPDRISDDALIETILDMIGSKSTLVFRSQIQALIERPDGTPVLDQITCPTLFLCGEQDTWSPLDRHYDMAALVPGSQVVPIANAGHMSTMEQPEAVTEAFRHWLARPSRAVDTSDDARTQQTEE